MRVVPLMQSLLVDNNMVTAILRVKHSGACQLLGLPHRPSLLASAIFQATQIHMLLPSSAQEIILAFDILYMWHTVLY